MLARGQAAGSDEVACVKLCCFLQILRTEYGFSQYLCLTLRVNYAIISKEKAKYD